MFRLNPGPSILSLAVCISLGCFCECQAHPMLQQDGGPKSLLKNASFQWQGGKLSSWSFNKGAGGNRGKHCQIEKGDDGSLQISGDASTRVWDYVGQKISVKPGTYLQLSYSVKTTDLRQEEGQNDNCYVGLWMTQKNGKQVQRVFYPATQDQYVPQQFVIPVPERATNAELMVFLSKTGTLNVKDLSLITVAAEDSFEVLVRQMDRYYSYFEHKKVDWPKLADQYRDDANAAAEDPKKFTEVLLPMLAELKDGHVWVKSGRKTLSNYRVDWKPNCDFRLIDKQLESVKRFGKMGLVAKTKGGLGYIRVTSLQGQPQQMQKLIGAVDDLFECPGMVVDYD